MREPKDSYGTLALAMLGGAVAAGPILGMWPVVSVLVVCGGVIFAAFLIKGCR